MSTLSLEILNKTPVNFIYKVLSCQDITHRNLLIHICNRGRTVKHTTVCGGVGVCESIFEGNMQRNRVHCVILLYF